MRSSLSERHIVSPTSASVTSTDTCSSDIPSEITKGTIAENRLVGGLGRLLTNSVMLAPMKKSRRSLSQAFADQSLYPFGANLTHFTSTLLAVAAFLPAHPLSAFALKLFFIEL
ncbi:hypothetical protein Tcan_10604 [Toxocara canis]|uniref:Uncharacterized protein n=1 Tax=Toxocara canis TaxID=6265 RepID=A0A0B2UVU5_TOXCA|nr:hypothetical protein Tcan_10604 [Toxocara canis]